MGRQTDMYSRWIILHHAHLSTMVYPCTNIDKNLLSWDDKAKRIDAPTVMISLQTYLFMMVYLCPQSFIGIPSTIKEYSIVLAMTRLAWQHTDRLMDSLPSCTSMNVGLPLQKI